MIHMGQRLNILWDAKPNGRSQPDSNDHLQQAFCKAHVSSAHMLMVTQGCSWYHTLETMGWRFTISIVTYSDYVLRRSKLGTPSQRQILWEQSWFKPAELILQHGISWGHHCRTSDWKIDWLMMLMLAKFLLLFTANAKNPLRQRLIKEYKGILRSKTAIWQWVLSLGVRIAKLVARRRANYKSALLGIAAVGPPSHWEKLSDTKSGHIAQSLSLCFITSRTKSA